jgi:hypothetical protein
MMAAKMKDVYLNELEVDGKLLHTWEGKRIPVHLKKLIGLKGVLFKQVHSRVEVKDGT